MRQVYLDVQCETSVPGCPVDGCTVCLDELYGGQTASPSLQILSHRLCQTSPSTPSLRTQYYMYSHCTHTVLMLYSCTHNYVLIYSYSCTELILNSYCTHNVLTLYSHCTIAVLIYSCTVLIIMYSYTHYVLNSY